MDNTRKRKSAADRRAEIIETVIALSADIGPDRVTTQHLADRVGVTQPAIFRHFSTKSEIWDAVSARIAENVTEAAKPKADQTGTHLSNDTIHAHLGRYFKLVHQRPSVPSILHSRELQAGNEALRLRFQTLMHNRRTWIADLVHRGQKDGHHRADLRAKDIANLILNAVQGLSMQWTLENRGFDLITEGGRLTDTLMDSIRQP